MSACLFGHIHSPVQVHKVVEEPLTFSDLCPPVAGVCVLLLSAPTVSAVSLSVSPNLQQFFRGSSVSLSCVDDGQTADGWTVKRTRGNLTEECGAAGSGFWMKFGSSCFVDLSAPSETFWCEDSSGQQSDRVSFSVQSETKEKNLILEIPALPVRTGSDVILHCRQRNGATVTAFFFIKGHRAENEIKPEHNITKITQADEGLYSCSTDQGGNSPQSSLRVRDPPTIIHPPPPPSSLLVPVVAGLVSVVLLVLGLVLFLCWKLKDKHAADPQAVYSDVRTQTSGPEDVAYGQVVIKSKKKAGKRTEQSPDPYAVYSSVRAGS
ncbi:unnamed protein product [Oreochromis niloticus]|nr:unnamed protein product [Mustela putorius furo]